LIFHTCAPLSLHKCNTVPPPSGSSLFFPFPPFRHHLYFFVLVPWLEIAGGNTFFVPPISPFLVGRPPFLLSDRPHVPMPFCFFPSLPENSSLSLAFSVPSLALLSLILHRLGQFFPPLLPPPPGLFFFSFVFHPVPTWVVLTFDLTPPSPRNSLQILAPAPPFLLFGCSPKMFSSIVFFVIFFLTFYGRKVSPHQTRFFHSF